MDLTTLQQILINFIPAISILMGFLASAFGLLKNMKTTFKNSNIEAIKDQIADENSAIRKEINKLIDLTSQLMEENKKLKEQNGKLLTELTRIADYSEEE